MTQFSNLSQFKKNLKVGAKLAAIYHKEFAGRDEQGNPVWKDKVLDVRGISIVQSNAFACKTVRSDGKEVDSWCHLPKAKDAKIENNRLTIFEDDGSPILTYWFVN